MLPLKITLGKIAETAISTACDAGGFCVLRRAPPTVKQKKSVETPGDIPSKLNDLEAPEDLKLQAAGQKKEGRPVSPKPMGFSLAKADWLYTGSVECRH